MNISCLIVEDEPNAVKLMEKYIDRVPFLQLKGICTEGNKALALLSAEKIDLVFMDINLPEISGMELSKLFSFQHIIFTTAYSNFAVESYSVNAIDYLLKPINFDRFYQAVTKAKRVLEYYRNPSSTKDFTSDFLFLKTGKKIISVAFSEVLYFEGSKEYATVKTLRGNHLVYKRMKDIEGNLPENFMRVHNSFIVNLQAISKIEDNQVFIGEHSIPISEKYREAFLTKVNRSLL